MTESFNQANAATHSTGTPVGVFIQKISRRVLQIYDDLQEVSNITKDARLAVLKSTKVRPRALTRMLSDYKESCQCPELKMDVQNIIYAVEDMIPGGEARLFVCHSKKDLKSKLEFVCVAVRTYQVGSETVSDFCISTYSYAKSIDKEGVAIGIGITTAGACFGALAGLGISTGGVGFLVVGTIAAALGIVSIGTGTAVICAATDTALEAQFRDILEASFLHELVSRGHAVLQQGRLFITHSDNQQPDD